jgi:hypothetical protein
MSINANSNVIEAIATVLGGGAGGAGRIQRGGSAPLGIQLLVVGGGAAGSVNDIGQGNKSYAGGGGGAVYSGSVTLGLATQYTITVGQSGSVTAGFPNTSTGGSSSFFGPNPAGGNFDFRVAGAVGTASAAPNSNPGGTGAGATSLYGGGGGGWTAAGTNGAISVPGIGGSGSIWLINGDGAGAFGGGGGGGIIDLAGTVGGEGRDGGGTGGGMTNDATAGIRGTGGGGGAAGNNNDAPAKPGGCGSVRIAYPTPSSTASGISYGLGGEITTGSFGGVEYTIHTFYADGIFETRVR